MSDTATIAKPGTAEWRTSVVEAMRKRLGLADDVDLRVKGIAAPLEPDTADPYKFTARITSGSLDRDHEVVLPDGADLREFDKSGAGFFNHDYDRLPIFVPGKVTVKNGEVIGQGRFLKNQFAEDVREFVTAMAAAGKSAGVSIGFVPLDARKPSKKDIERFGDGIKTVFTRWKLLEWSIAPVQANANAYVTSVGKRLGAERLKALFPSLDIPDEVQPTPARKLCIIVPRYDAPPKPARKQVDYQSLVESLVVKAIRKQRGFFYED